jgi:hypothetical protein
MLMAAESAPTSGHKQEIKPRLFISCSRNDQPYRKRFKDLFGSLFEIDSVPQSATGGEDSSAYIQSLIQGNHITVISVVIVLVGKDTWGRKHIDWEIAAALTKKADGYSGLMGLCLPTHPAFRNIEYKTGIVPYRLVDNINSGYAKFYDWTESEGDMRLWIKDAFQARINRAEMINNTRPHYTGDWSSYAKWSPSVTGTETVDVEEPVEEAVDRTFDNI